VTVEFRNNKARLSGASIFASDMQQCSWLGSNYTQENTLIFNPPQELLNSFPSYPFKYRLVWELVALAWSRRGWWKVRCEDAFLEKKKQTSILPIKCMFKR